MLNCRQSLLLGSMIFLAGCLEAPVEYVNVIPDVPSDLRQPVAVPQREASTLKDVGLILADHVEALDKANGKIIATDCILTAAETGEEAPC